ncbi:hypothetical protein [Christiangramia echinicola]|uniref:hypothetical protein n=1 Tax=Christiangramia echinicola TaxID=279359 RepID=UPI000402DCD2|nr:hypothetical protein [Christiangramia echinicola]
MPLKSKFKSHLFHALELLSRNQGDNLYHFLQNLFFEKDLDHKISSSFNTYKIVEQVTEKNGIKIQDKVIVEIGSGWLPLMPYFFKYMGKASQVISYDLNKHYQKKNIKKLNQTFSQNFDKLIKVSEKSEFPLPEGVAYFPKTDITNHDIFGADIIFSRFVLEHVEPEMIREMHLKFKKDLNPGSYIIHLISPSDHRAYSDKKLSLQDFLRFSKEEWNQVQTRFDYHNRLRLPQYLDIFKDLNYDIVDLTYDKPSVDSENYRKFKKLTLHEDFDGYTDEELMAGSINLVLKV